MSSEATSTPAVSTPVPSQPVVKSAWSPLGVPVFRLLWLAYLISLIGTWAREAGGPWLMQALREKHGDAPVWVSLIQPAATLPICFLSIAAGVLADIFDRRKLLIWTNVWMLFMAALLAGTTLAGRTTPQLLLVFTFLLQIGAALAGPAFQYVIPELVPASDLPLAVALNSVALNVARALGPALGMLVIMFAGLWMAKVPAIGASFIVNAVAFVGVIWVLVKWKRGEQKRPAHRETLASASITAFRFTYHSKAMRAILIRVATFILCAVIIWAQLPVMARRQFAGGDWTYLLLMTAVGVGAVIGVFFMPKLDKRFSTEGMVAICTVVFGLSLMGVSRCKGPSELWLAIILLMVVGFNWVIVPTNFNIATQRSVPGWVKGRAIAMYMTVLFGSFAVGSPIWGSLTQKIGISNSLLIAGLLVCVGALMALLFPLTDEVGRDFRPANLPAPDEITAAGEIALHIAYPVMAEREGDFERFMRDQLRRQRLRNGALRWDLARKAAAASGGGLVYEESIIFGNWSQRMRFHSRTSKADAEQEAQVSAFLPAGGAPIVEHRALPVALPEVLLHPDLPPRHIPHPPPVIDWDRVVTRALEEFDAIWNRIVREWYRK